MSLTLFQDGKAYSIVTDHLGTPVEAYNEQGEEVWYRRLDMNGKVIEERSMNYTFYKDYVKIPFLFQGQYYDEEIKLAYNRFRYYAPELGRYISEDPIRFASGTFALFSYVKDTNGWLDLFGLNSYKKEKNRTASTPKDAQKKVIKGQGPSEIYRIDAPDSNVPKSQWHAHGKGKHGGALNLDGSIHDSDPKFSKKTKKWLKKYGWNL